MSVPDTPNTALRVDTDAPTATGAPHLQGPEAAAQNWTFVPIRSLGPRHRGRIAAHLTSLAPNDRYLRFGYPATDPQIAKYVDLLDFEQDEVFGIFSRRLELIALAHLAHRVDAPPTEASAMSEFGVSVLPHARGRGFGRRLFEHAMLHARNRGVDTLLIHALSENIAMLKIARNAGATVVREGSETDAWLRLPPDTLASHVGELVGEQAAELDYQLKLRARQASELLGVLGEVKSSLAKAAHVAED